MLLLVPFLALVALAGLEIYVIVVIAHAIGIAWTVAALIASTLAGLALVRAQRRRAWSALREAVASGVVPDRELGDAALIFTGGALFVIPGFVTDALGLLAVAPLTRPAMRRLLGVLLLPRAAALGMRAGRMGGRGTGTHSPEEPGEGGTGKVIRGHVIDGGAAPGK